MLVYITCYIIVMYRARRRRTRPLVDNDALFAIYTWLFAFLVFLLASLFGGENGQGSMDFLERGYISFSIFRKVCWFCEGLKNAWIKFFIFLLNLSGSRLVFTRVFIIIMSSVCKSERDCSLVKI